MRIKQGQFVMALAIAVGYIVGRFGFSYSICVLTAFGVGTIKVITSTKYDIEVFFGLCIFTILGMLMRVAFWLFNIDPILKLVQK